MQSTVFSQSVKVLRPSTCRELYDLIEGLQNMVRPSGALPVSLVAHHPTPCLPSRPPPAQVITDLVCLVVVDSIAALARKESLQELDREQFVIGQAAMLKTLAERCVCDGRRRVPVALPC